jgi:putative hemolysin
MKITNLQIQQNIQSAKRINKSSVNPLIIADWVRDKKDLQMVQKLRYKIFKKEMGANIKGSLDKDTLDDYCEHLIIKDAINNQPVGTYRILTPYKAKEYGSLYTESEFNIGSLASIKNEMIELGRACIDKKYRTGGVIMMLWAEIAKFMVTNKFRYLIGCSSVSVKDGGFNAANLYNQLKSHKQFLDLDDVYPLHPLPVEKLCNDEKGNIPPLLNGYIRLGAKIIGKPAWDPEFQTADFLTLLDLENLPSKYKAHFLK